MVAKVNAQPAHRAAAASMSAKVGALAGLAAEVPAGVVARGPTGDSAIGPGIDSREEFIDRLLRFRFVEHGCVPDLGQG